MNIYNSYNKQLEFLCSHGIDIGHEKQAVKFLQTNNFYRLLPMMKPFFDRKEHVSLKRIKRIVRFDDAMRLLLYEAVQDIELFLRCKFAHYHTQKYGPLGYLEKNNFSKEHNTSKFNSRIKSTAETHANNPMIKGFGSWDNIPLGVIIDFFSMGMLSEFYDDMITECKKKLAGELYGATARQMVSWLCVLTEIRNKCAHYSRLYMTQFTTLPVIPREKNFTANRRLFTQILVLSFLYPDDEQWNGYFLESIRRLMNGYSADIEPEHIGFPEKWENLLEK